MKRLVLEPEGWPCTLRGCPPGFFVHGETVGLKTEYGAMESDGPMGSCGTELHWICGGGVDAYCDSGERFCGGVRSREEAEALLVQPVAARWVEDGT